MRVEVGPGFTALTKRVLQYIFVRKCNIRSLRNIRLIDGIITNNGILRLRWNIPRSSRVVVAPEEELW